MPTPRVFATAVAQRAWLEGHAETADELPVAKVEALIAAGKMTPAGAARAETQTKRVPRLIELSAEGRRIIGPASRTRAKPTA